MPAKLRAVFRVLFDELMQFLDRREASGDVQGRREKSGQDKNGVLLSERHHAILEAAKKTPLTAKAIARQAGLTYSGRTRQLLADLVRWGHLSHGPDGYALV